MAAPSNFWQQQQQGGGLGMAGADASAAHAVPAVAAVAPADADEKLSTTWTHIVAVAGSEAKALDLMELLNGARREDTYQFPVPGVSAACLQLRHEQHTLPAAAAPGTTVEFMRLTASPSMLMLLLPA